MWMSVAQNPGHSETADGQGLRVEDRPTPTITRTWWVERGMRAIRQSKDPSARKEMIFSRTSERFMMKV